MAKREPTVIQKITPNLQLPEHLRGRAVVGTELLKQFVIVPRLKVVQKQADMTLLEKFRVGDVILSPTQTMIAEMMTTESRAPEKRGPAFSFTPLFFYPDWATWNPIELRGQEPAIAYRTNNPKDPIVAKSRDAQLRMEPMLGADGQPMKKQGKELTRRHVEHLNYIVVLHDHEYREPLIMSFARGEHFAGSNFAGLIRMRNASLFYCNFEARATWRPGKGQGDWYGLDIGNPTVDGVSPWVSDEQAEQHQKWYNQWRQTMTERGIRADFSETDDIIDPDEVIAGEATGARSM